MYHHFQIFIWLKKVHAISRFYILKALLDSRISLRLQSSRHPKKSQNFKDKRICLSGFITFFRFFVSRIANDRSSVLRFSDSPWSIWFIPIRKLRNYAIKILTFYRVPWALKIDPRVSWPRFSNSPWSNWPLLKRAIKKYSMKN